MNFITSNTISFVLSEFSNMSRAVRREQLFSVVMFSSIAFKILSSRSDVLLIACDYRTQRLIFNRNICKCVRNVKVWHNSRPFIITGYMKSIRNLISSVNNNNYYHYNNKYYTNPFPLLKISAHTHNS